MDLLILFLHFKSSYHNSYNMIKDLNKELIVERVGGMSAPGQLT